MIRPPAPSPDPEVWYDDHDSGEIVGFDQASKSVVAELRLPTPNPGPVRNMDVDEARQRIWLALSDVGRLGGLEAVTQAPPSGSSLARCNGDPRSAVRARLGREAEPARFQSQWQPPDREHAQYEQKEEAGRPSGGDHRRLGGRGPRHRSPVCRARRKGGAHRPHARSVQSAYCASKAAVRGFTDSLRSELYREGSKIAVTMLQLPAVNTPQFEVVRNRLGNHPQPVPPIYQPEVIARAAVHAALHPKREMWIGWNTIKGIVSQRFIPGLLDRYLAKGAWDSQTTRELPPGHPRHHHDDGRARFRLVARAACPRRPPRSTARAPTPERAPAANASLRRARS